MRLPSQPLKVKQSSLLLRRLARGIIEQMKASFAALALAALAACQSGKDTSVPGDSADTRPFSGIAPDETLQLTGTEPFWGGQVSGNTMTYTTPENFDGDTIPVKRFAGRGGLSFSGTFDEQPVDMTITPGECSDAMSDRTYPFVVTLRLGDETRKGCAWSEDHPFTGPLNP